MANWEENKHPRDEGGKFTSKGGTKNYPKGTDKEYTDKVNKKYESSLPILEKLGIKLEDFGGRRSAEGGYEDNSKEIMNKYVFEPFREKYPHGNNEVWEKEYQPLYDAIESVLDKNYNDWWIKTDGGKDILEIDDDYERAYGEAPDKEEFPEAYKKYVDNYKKWLNDKTEQEEKEKASKLFGLPF